MNHPKTFSFLAILLIVLGAYIILSSPHPGRPRHQLLHWAPPTRGRILAADGTPLAEHRDLWSIHLDPQAFGMATNVWTNARVAHKVAELLHLDETTVNRLIQEPTNRYVHLKDTTDSNEVAAVRVFGRHLRLCIQKHDSRNYPLGRAACHAVGFCIPALRWCDEVDLAGGMGFEAKFDDKLKEGLDVTTDIIPPVQLALYETVTNAVATSGSRSACGIAFDPTRTKVLARVSFPDFNPHQYNTASDDERTDRSRKLTGKSITNQVTEVVSSNCITIISLEKP